MSKKARTRTPINHKPKTGEAVSGMPRLQRRTRVLARFAYRSRLAERQEA